MIGNNYLLDTNIVSAWLDNNTGIAKKINEASQIFIPIIVIGEMYYGAQYSAKVDIISIIYQKLLQIINCLLLMNTLANITVQ